MIANITMDRVFSCKNMDKALKTVSRKDVTPGMDGMRATMLPEYWSLHHRMILSEINDGCYTPTPLKVIFINKPGRQEKRQISICTALDQMLQNCIRYEVERCFTPGFHPDSDGFISGRSTGQAAMRCLQYMNAGKECVVDADIRKCFDSIKHRIVMRELGTAISDRRIYALAEKYLKNPGILRGALHHNRVGLPQGSCLSPALANLVLNRLDWHLNRQNIAFVRYADDLLLFCRTWDEAEKAKALLEDYLEKELSLRLNGEKTHILSAGEIGYLGYSFRKYGNRYALSLDDDVRKKMRCRMEAHIKRKSDTAEMLDRIGAFNRGWLEYYGKAHPTDLIPFIHEVQSRELKLITNKIDCMSGTDQDAMRLILSTKGYVTLSEWYDELRERGVCYDEELR